MSQRTARQQGATAHRSPVHPPARPGFVIQCCSTKHWRLILPKLLREPKGRHTPQRPLCICCHVRYPCSHARPCMLAMPRVNGQSWVSCAQARARASSHHLPTTSPPPRPPPPSHDLPTTSPPLPRLPCLPRPTCSTRVPIPWSGGMSSAWSVASSAGSLPAHPAECNGESM